MRRLDDRTTTRGTLYLVVPMIVAACVIPMFPNRYGDRGAPLEYWAIVAAFTAISLRWCLRMRRVEFDGKQFIISGYFGRAEVPSAHLVRVRPNLFSQGRFAALILTFDPPTQFGRRIPLYPGVPQRSKAFQKLAAELTAIANKEPLPGTRPTPNDKQLAVDGWTEAELKKVLTQFAELYELPNTFARIEQGTKAGTYSATFPCDLDPETFIYLVNYVCYPENFDLGGRELAVVGFSTITNKFPDVPSSLVGQNAMFYVPAEDEAYDIVYLRTENGNTYELPFSGFNWKRAGDPRLPTGVADLIAGAGAGKR